MGTVKESKLWGKYIAFGNITINHVFEKINIPIVNIGGFLLLLLVIGYSFIVPCPSRFQYLLLRIGFSFGIVASLLPLFKNLSFGKHNIKGGFAVGLILLSYLVNPTAISKTNNCNTYSYTEGHVFQREKGVKGVTVRLPHQDFEMQSNGSGRFFLPWKEEQDSSSKVLVQLEWQEGDTAFYWTKSKTPLLIHLADHFKPLSMSIIKKLLMERVRQLEDQLKGNQLEWRIEENQLVSHEELLDLYQPFEQMNGYKQNHYEFSGLEQHLMYYKNLCNAGIKNIKPLSPYQKHHIDSASIYVLSHSKASSFQLTYFFRNLKEVSCEVVQQRRISDTKYKITVAYSNNIRGLKVRLEEQRKKNVVKVRHMNYYGFLPQEEYELSFEKNKWTLKQIKK